MSPPRPRLAALLTTGLLATGLPTAAPASGEDCPADNYCSPLDQPNLRSAKVSGGKGVLTATARLRFRTTVRLTVTRAGRSSGVLTFVGRKGTNVRAVRTLRGRPLRRGTYRVRVSASGHGRTFTVRVR